MCEVLSSIMNMLKDPSSSLTDITILLKDSKVADLLNLGSIVESLSSLREDTVPRELAERLIGIISLTFQEMRQKAEDELNGKLLSSNYTHYKEVITAVENPDNDPTIISKYSGQEESKNLDYSVLSPNIPEGIFNIGLLKFEINTQSMTQIPYKNSSGELKFACYQFTIEASTQSESKDFSRNFKAFDMDSLFNLLGMPYISNKHYKSRETGGRAQIEVDTRPFFQGLIDTYNMYYSTIKTNMDMPLIDIHDIGRCYVDSNGLFLVTRMFILSSSNIDGDISQPFIYNTNKAIEGVNTVQKMYRIVMKMKSSEYKREIIQDKIKQIIVGINEVSGIQLSCENRIKPTQDGNIVNINFEILGYRNLRDSEDQSEISKKLELEEKFSSALRLMCRKGLIEKTDYTIGRSGINLGTEKYIIGERSDSAFYSKSVVDILFYRSSFITKTVDSEDFSVISKNIIDRNIKKRIDTKDMIDAIHSNKGSILYNSNYWPNRYSNWFPTNIMPIHYERNIGANKEKCKAITFVPFGFMQYTQTDPIMTYSTSAASLYGIDFIFDSVSVKRVIKISTDENDTPNIVQIIFKTKTEPVFENGGDKPLKTFYIDQYHYLCLFRSSNAKFITTSDIEWDYACDYTQSIQDDIKLDSISSVSIDLLPVSSVIITPSRLLRYFIETINIDHPFINSLINSQNIISSSVSTMYDLLEKIKEGKIDIGDIPLRFFELVANASVTGEINSNTIDWIVSILYNENILTQKIKSAIESSECVDINTQPKWINVLKTFFKSIQKPIRISEYPIYDSIFESELYDSFNKSITNIRSKLFDDLDKFNSQKVSNQSEYFVFAKSIASEFHGIERYVANIVLEGLEGGEKLSMLKQQILSTLGDIVNQIDFLIPLINSNIDHQFITTASSKLHPEVFNHFIKLLYTKLNTDNFSNEIMDLCRKCNPTAKFIVTQISIYRYKVKTDTVDHNLMSLNDTYMDHSELQIKVKNTYENIFTFGKQTYNPDVHCMFSVSYKSVDKIEDVIANSLSECNIYYILFGENVEITDVSILSLYGKPMSYDGMMVVKFFLPFHNNKGRLAIKTKEWSTDYGVFKLENPTVEVEVTTNSNLFSLDEHDSGYENVRNTLTYLSQDMLVDIDEENPDFVINLCIGINGVKKSYSTTSSTSFYLFTDTLTNVVSDTYSFPDVSIPERIWTGLNDLRDITRYKSEDLNITINICPIAASIVKYYVKFNKIIIGEGRNRFIDDVARKRKFKILKRSTCDSIVLNFLDNIDSFFATFESENFISDVETLIITNNSGIYTLGYGDLEIERKLARSETVFTPPELKVDLNGIDIISDLDYRSVKDLAEKELDKKMESNIIHNLVIATKNVKWDTVKVNTHRFFRNESPKWIKFSPDKQFFGIGFQSGVKVYIRTGEHYTFCTNLNHECVRDIYFGNSKFCITIQYEDSSRPFGHLWITSAGVRVNSIPIKYYQPSVGDFVNAKISSGGVFKDIKNVILEQNVDGKFTVKGKVVETFTTVHDYNNYYFSANDSYLVVNRNKSFIVYDLKNFEPVVFNSVNGVTLLRDEEDGELLDKTKIPHCFETGSWNDDNVFVGITFIPITQAKMRVFLNIEKKSITSTILKVDYPRSLLYRSMVKQTTTDVHPLFNYLMNFREKLGTRKQRGIWIYNLFIGFEMINGEPNLTFLTDYGMYSTTPISVHPDLDLDSEESITLFLRDISQIFEFDVSNGNVKKITWMNSVIYDFGEIKINPSVISQFIDGNYFAFHNNSVYVWKYVDGKTELTHIDINGYERFLIHDIVIIYVTDRLQIATIYEKYLIIKDINSKNNVEYEKIGTDYSKVNVNIDKKFNSDFLVTTETSFESYTNDVNIAVNVDGKPISSAMCLNRYPDFKMKQHNLVNKENVFQHGNLLLIVKDNEVKIIPKSVQVPKNIDGFTYEWYSDHNTDTDEYWLFKKSEIDNYINDVRELIPSLFAKENKRPFVYVVGDYFNGRNEQTFDDGMNAALRDFKIPDVYDQEIIRELFTLTKNASIIYNKENAVRLMNEFWTKNNSEFSRVLYKIKDDDERENTLRRIIEILNYIFGPIFYSVEVGNAFKMLMELSSEIVDGRKVNRKLSDIESIIRSQIDLDEISISQKQSCKIILLILRLPIKGTQTIHIDTFSGFQGRLVNLFNEIKKFNKMTNPSNYEICKSLEINDLKREYLNFLIQSQAIRAKTSPTQQEPDFICSLKRKMLKLEAGNEFTETTYPIGVLQFDENGDAILGDKFYHAIDLFVFDTLEEEYDPSAIYNGAVISCSCIENNIIRMEDAYYIAVEILTKFMMNKDLVDVFGSDVINSENILKILGYYDCSKDKRHIPLSSFTVNIMSEFANSINGDKKFIENVINQLCNDLISLNNPLFLTSIDSLKNFLFSIAKIRFPESLESRDIFDKSRDIYLRCIDTYNTEISMNENIDLLMLNIQYVDMMSSMYRKMLNEGNYLSNGTYNDDFHLISGAFTPLLNKYRNGLCEEKNIPVLAIKIKFPSNVTVSKMPISTHDEFADITLNYEIPEKDKSFDNKFGTLTFNLKDIIMGMYPRDYDNILLDDITDLVVNGARTLMNAVEFGCITELESVTKVKTFFPPITRAFSTISEYIAGFITEYDFKIKIAETVDELKQYRNRLYQLYPKFNQILMVTGEVKYIFDHTFAGIDFDVYQVPFEYVSKKIMLTTTSIDTQYQVISYDGVRPQNTKLKFVTKPDGSCAIFDFNNSTDKCEVIMMYGNCSKNGNIKGFVTLMNPQTKKTFTHIFEKVDFKTTNIKSISVNENNEIVLVEIYEKERHDFITKANVREIKEETILFRDLKSFLMGNEIPPKDLQINKKDKYHKGRHFSYLEPSTQNDYIESVISNLKVISQNGITSIYYQFLNNNTGLYGSVIDVYENKNGILTKIHSWIFDRFTVKNIGFNKKKMIIVGLNGYIGGENVRIGEMNMTEYINDEPMTVKDFNNTFSIANANIQTVQTSQNTEEQYFDNCFINVGVTSYVVYNARAFSNFVIIKDSSHYEKKFNTEITSINVSKESGYVALYFKTSGMSEIWNSNCELVDTVEGECNWM